MVNLQEVLEYLKRPFEMGFWSWKVKIGTAEDAKKENRNSVYAFLPMLRCSLTNPKTASARREAAASLGTKVFDPPERAGYRTTRKYLRGKLYLTSILSNAYALRRIVISPISAFPPP
jgi:hypothetical protein